MNSHSNSLFGLVFVLPLLAVAVWIFYTSWRALARGELSPQWRLRLIVLSVIGIGLGNWFAFFKVTEVPEQIRFTGFPIPTELYRFTDGEWRNVSPPRLVVILGTLTNFITGVAAALLPAKLAAFINQAKETFPKRP